MAELSHLKRPRDDSAEFDAEFGLDPKKIREDLLSLLDDVADDRDSPSQDLDSVIRSFEEEISGTSKPPEIVDLTSDSGESMPELGLSEDPQPPELLRVASGIGEFWDFQDEFPGYDSFGFGPGFGEYNSGLGENDEEYVALDGIFDYSDVNFGSSDVTWRPGSLPAM